MRNRDWIPALALATLAAPAPAGVGLYDCLDVVRASTVPVSVFTIPDGTGHALTGAFTLGGGSADASLAITVVDQLNDPIAGFPAEDIYLEPQGETSLVFCAGGGIADAPTDAEGRTAFDEALLGGGSLAYVADETWLQIGSYNCYSVRLDDVSVNSADIDGDLVVDLTDVILFAEDYWGTYDYRSDFHWDGQVNLSDLVLLSQGWGASCP
jgi:hypothetical protein